MTTDIYLLKAMLSKIYYMRYSLSILKLKNLSKEYKIILDIIKGYFDKNPESNSLSVDDLILSFKTQYPVLKADIYHSIFSDLSSIVVDPTLLDEYLGKTIERHITAQMVVEFGDVLNGDQTLAGVMDKYQDAIDQIKQGIVAEEDDLCTATLSELIEEHLDTGYKWRLEFLNEQVGRVRPGTLAHVFAYSETGKTAFAVSEAVNFCQQVEDDECVLFLVNEEPVGRTILRSYTSLIGKPIDIVKQHVERAEEVWAEKIGTKLLCFDGVEHIAQVERYIQKYKPKIVFIDQGTNVQIQGDFSSTEKLAKLYAKYRKLAVQYRLVIITLGQADNASHNKQWLQLNNMDMSKIGIPGALDLAIGIGALDAPGKENVRYISICKNKLSGSHERHQVRFKQDISLYY